MFIIPFSGSSLLTPILGAMLGDGPIRMITQGQELTYEVDEKTLSEMTFKDGQVMDSSRKPPSSFITTAQVTCFLQYC